jgi:hypothetical protein
MPVIRISDDVFRRLQKHATPLVDSTNDVLRRILDVYESRRGQAQTSAGSEPTLGGRIVTTHFTPWTQWAGRDRIDGVNLAGVYLLGKFDGAPPGVVDPTAPEIIYIGITERQTLRKRWEQFAASAFRRELGHSGGWTFNARYCNSEPCSAPDWLYVAAMPVDKDEVATIRPAKQQLLADFSALRGGLPSCNTRSA